MILVRHLLRWMTGVIHLLLAAILLYFPFAELLARLGQETRIDQSHSNLEVEDSLLPCLALALTYALVSTIRRKIEPANTSDANTRDPSKV